MPTLLDDLILYREGDEASGNMLDAHTGAHHGTETSGTIAAGTGGRDFEAADTEYFTTADHADFGVNSFTIAVEVELESKPAGGMYILSKWGADGNRSWRLYWDDGADRFIFVVSAAGSSSVSVTATNFGAPSLATKYHIVCKHDADLDIISIQVNGGVPNTASHTTGVFNNTGAFVVGALFTTGASSYWDGVIGKLGWWGRVLLPIEERALYNAGTPIGYADFDTDIPVPVITTSIGTDTHQAQSGTINALSVGTTAIVGTGTAFTSEFTTSNRLVLEMDDGTFCSYDITAIADDTHLTITGGLIEATDGDETPYKEGSDHEYSTPQLWEADLDDGLVYADGDNAVGECYDDSIFNIGVGGFLIVDGGIAIGGTAGRKLASLTLSVAAAERHDGTAGTGARLVVSADNNTVDGSCIEWRYNTVTMPYVFEWLELDMNGFQVNEVAKDQFESGNVTAISRHLVIHGSVIDGESVNHYGFQYKGGSAGTRQVLHNIVIYDFEHQADGWLSAFQVMERQQLIYNCTIHNFRGHTGEATITGITAWLIGSAAYVDASTDECKNNLCTTVTSELGTAKCFDVPSTTVSNNLSTDDTATGTGSVTGITAADQYVSIVEGSEDLHLKAGADAIDAGADLGTTYGVNIDIDGRDRDAEEDTWDAGADEYVAPPDPPASTGGWVRGRSRRAGVLAGRR